MQNPTFQLRNELLLFQVHFNLPISDEHKHCVHAYTYLSHLIISLRYPKKSYEVIDEKYVPQLGK